MLAVAILLSSTASAQNLVTELVSKSSLGVAGNADSGYPSLSHNGRFVAFQSTSANLVSGDTNQSLDAFVRDVLMGTTERISLSSQGAQANGDCVAPAISADGRMVCFRSSASNLVTGDSNGVDDIFLHDRVLHSTRRVSVASDGSQGDSWSVAHEISANGLCVVFVSNASNLVPGDTNGVSDVFVHDLTTLRTTRVSVDSLGVGGNGNCGGVSYYDRTAAISADGRFVAFASFASNLVGGDGNNKWDVFWHDRLTAVTRRASISTSGLQGNSESYDPSISSDGRFVAFESFARLDPEDVDDQQDVYVYDMQASSIVLATRIDSSGLPANGEANNPALDASGRYLCFDSSATDMIIGDTNAKDDVFARDLAAGATTRWSIPASGLQYSDHSKIPDISADGMTLAYWNLNQVWIRRPNYAAPSLYCLGKPNSQSCTPAMSATGIPSATSTSGFLLSATPALNNKPGLLFYSLSGRASLPFQGGTLCVAAPIRRTSVVGSGGNPPPIVDCSGSFGLDFNAFASGALGGTPVPELLVAGTQVNAQWWGRDPGFAAPDNTQLSNAAEFFVKM